MYCSYCLYAYGTSVVMDLELNHLPFTLLDRCFGSPAGNLQGALSLCESLPGILKDIRYSHVGIVSQR